MMPVVAAAVLLAGCGTPGVDPSGVPGETTVGGRGAVVTAAPVVQGPLTLRASLAPGTSSDLARHPEPGLVVAYTVVNAGTTDALALDRVPDGLGSGRLPANVDPEHAWVHAVDGGVRVTKQAFALAPNVRFLMAPVIGARVVPAGGELHGRAYAPLPPALDVPGTTFEAPRGAVDRAATRWQFCLQVLPAPAAVSARPTEGPVLSVPVVDPTPENLLCTAPTEVPPA